jgi:hypothetical protein
VIKAVRWIFFIPLALVSSVLIGALASWLADLFGGSAWYVWLISGVASGWAFFFIALRVAPTRSPVVKWSSVLIVSALGLIAALGPLLTGRNPVSALAGAAMVFLAVYYARLSTDAISADLVGAGDNRQETA